MTDLATVYAALRRAIGTDKQSEWAREHGISPAYLSFVLNGVRPPGPAILAAIGMRRRVVYEPIPAGSANGAMPAPLRPADDSPSGRRGMG